MRIARPFLFAIFAIVAATSLAQDQETAVELAEALKDPDFAVQGEYVGPKRAMQVIALGDGEFEAVLFGGGLPGAGWNNGAPQRVDVDADEIAEIVDFNQMSRVERSSPTLGLKPPQGAITLFDGTKETFQKRWKPGAKITADGLLEQGATSVDEFQDFSLHVEFQTPFKPKARGQARGNSGVYYQGRFETQVLDSFGLEGKVNETGGIYSIRAPDLNMCLPPLTWQTYDAEFTAAKFDESGKKTADAKLTVRLNGVVVQQDVSLGHATTAAPIKEGPEPGPIYIQNHKNPVRFRNIWVLPKDASKEARRPLVPSYERLYVATGRDQEAAGRLLIGELGCTHCHQSKSPAVISKQAPILDNAGGRIRPDYLLEFITSPHSANPGSTMPELLSQLPAKNREHAAKAIASFLLSSGTTVDRPGHPKSAARGKNLFHTIGCTACHSPQDGSPITRSTSVPLARVADKYTLDSLTQFLQNPHAVRPSGRMPMLVQGQDAADVATYLLREIVIGEAITNTKVAFYNGNWDKLPDFGLLEPVQQTQTYGFDIKAIEKNNYERFGAKFESYFHVPASAEYSFHVASDDGSRVYVDGKMVVDNDGVHGVQRKTGTVRLDEGMHSLQLDYFEKNGGEELKLEIKGGDLKRMPFEMLATLNKEGKPAKPLVETSFAVDSSLVSEGAKLFSSLGCVSCHQHKQVAAANASIASAPPLEKLLTEGGCLAEDVAVGLPDYELTSTQRTSIRAGLSSLKNFRESPPSDAEFVHATMAAMNCYACHSRGGLGGPESTKNSLFQSTMQEMGDEGRLPPPLDGVGDKLREDYIKKILAEGADERSYMRASMPGFGRKNLDSFSDALVRMDRRSESTIRRASETEQQTKASGRLLAGNKGLSCIKCHTAGGKGTGIRAIDMQSMTTRLREDWFHRYLMDPVKYRPGTRMPSSFPEGKSVLPNLYGGNPSTQVDALWQYLSDGKNARPPVGAEAKLIELAADSRPVIYRNFIEGLSPRGIAVGYPEGIGIAWDANSMSLSQVWKGAFIDASRHWIGRGQGKQPPLGDQILPLESAVPVAELASIDAPWPNKTARKDGYRFLGYRLNSQGQPTFRYRLGEIVVDDTPVPFRDESNQVGIRRELKLSGSARNLILRVASANKLVQSGDTYSVDDQYSVQVSSDNLQVVPMDDRKELRLPIRLVTTADDNLRSESTIVITIRW